MASSGQMSPPAQVEEKQGQEGWLHSRLEQQRALKGEQDQLNIDDKVYSYEENDVLPPIGDSSFLRESLESNKNLTNYDCFGEKTTGEEWVQRYKDDPKAHAKSPLYVEGRYQWVDVQVLAYDRPSDRYQIRTCAGGLSKWVNRLSVLFRDEDMDKFRSRLKICKMRQQVAEDDTRF